MLGAVTASLIGRYVVTTTIEEVPPGVPLAAQQREDRRQQDQRWPRHDEPQDARRVARREKQSTRLHRFATLLTVTAPLPAQLHGAIADVKATADGITVLDDQLAAHAAALPLAGIYRPRRRVWRSLSPAHRR